MASSPAAGRPSQNNNSQATASSTRMQRTITNQSAVSTPPAYSLPSNLISTPQAASTPGRSPLNVSKTASAGKTSGPSTLGYGNSPGPVMTPGMMASKTIHTASPSAGLGLDMTGAAMTPSLSNLGLGSTSSLLGGVGMSTGLSASGMIDETEMYKRLYGVVATLGKNIGRVSREGVERLGRRVRLDTLWEDRVLSLAGNTLVVDVEFSESIPYRVEGVKIAFHGLSDSVSEHADGAAKIMFEDLQVQGDKSPLTAKLDKFADNLERLSRMDKLSVPHANCFEAVTGIYSSLKRLYEHEKIMTERNNHEKTLSADAMVMHYGSGRPNMHRGDRVGLVIDYWSELHLLPGSRDGRPTQHDDKKKTWSVVLECEYSDPSLYPPIRVSPDWITETIVKPEKAPEADSEGHNTATYEWLEPVAPIAHDADMVGNDAASQQILGHARFVARMEPPVIMPLRIAAELLSDFGLNVNAPEIHHASVTNLLAQQIDPTVSTETKVIQVLRERTHGSVKGRSLIQSSFDCSDGSDAGYVVRHIPFSHPKQILAMLPVLRQYAVMNHLIARSFSRNANGSVSSSWTMNGHSVDEQIKRVKEQQDGNVEQHVTVTLVPQEGTTKPTIFTFRSTHGNDCKDLLVHVKDNGKIEVESIDVNDIAMKKLSQGISMTEDFGIWAEWFRELHQTQPT